MSTLESIQDEASTSIITFLKKNVRWNNNDNIESELKKVFLLAKKRGVQKRIKKRKKIQILTRKEKKAIGFYDIPKHSVKYNDVLPLNQIWNEYISQMLELDKFTPENSGKGWEQFTQTLYKADFHGCMIEVVRSKCPSYIGKKGICIMETKNTFKIVSIDNQVTTILKKDCVFDIFVNSIKICIFGKHLCVRPAERSTKKVKSYLHPDL